MGRGRHDRTTALTQNPVSRALVIRLCNDKVIVCVKRPAGNILSKMCFQTPLPLIYEIFNLLGLQRILRRREGYLRKATPTARTTSSSLYMHTTCTLLKTYGFSAALLAYYRLFVNTLTMRSSKARGSKLPTLSFRSGLRMLWQNPVPNSPFTWKMNTRVLVNFVEKLDFSEWVLLFVAPVHLHSQYCVDKCNLM